MEQSVEFIVGFSLLIIGLSLLIHTQIWIEWMKQIHARGSVASLGYGSLNLLLGSIVVILHPDWDGLGFFATLVGYIMVLKGVVYLLYPAWLPKKLNMLMPSMKNWLRFSAVLTASFGALILYGWCECGVY